MDDEAGLTSQAEAKLDARVRPEILRLRARTPYPKRRSAACGDSVRPAQLTGPAGATAHPDLTGKAVRRGHARSGS